MLCRTHRGPLGHIVEGSTIQSRKAQEHEYLGYFPDNPRNFLRLLCSRQTMGSSGGVLDYALGAPKARSDSLQVHGPCEPSVIVLRDSVLDAYT
jgi:hypothetical protein